ncbi:MAG: DEAD/DEAH box helicase family protein [Ktedonobacterales bacterium]|nr:DEAD/DEAH box helicase family protein [Ktedonobacterales bacterium]
MPGNERSGNSSARRGRKLRRHVQLSEDAARTLRALLATFPGCDEEGIVATLIDERWAQIAADAPMATTHGHGVERRPAALPLTAAAALAAPAPALSAPDAPTAALPPEAEVASLDLSLLGDFTPSDYQRAVFNHIINATGNALIAAVAGSGKTTTILHAAKLIEAQRRTWMFLAFNASIEEEINHKLSEAGMKGAARTAHKIGLGTLFKHLGKQLNPAPKELKYRVLARTLVISTVRPRSQGDEKHCTAALTDLVRLARLTLTNPSDTVALLAMADHYALELEPEPLKLPEPQSDHEARQQARQRAERKASSISPT